MYAHIVFINFEHILCTNVLLRSNVESFYPNSNIKTSNEICFVANILNVHTQFKDLFNTFDLQTNNVILIFNIK